MPTAHELAKLIITEDSFLKSVEFVTNEITKKAFHPDFAKEMTWQLEGMHKQTVFLIGQAIADIYTPEEIDILYDLHQKYPWMATKAELLTQQAATNSAKLGDEIAHTIFNNLESTGDLNKIMEEGFFIQDQEEVEEMEEED